MLGIFLAISGNLLIGLGLFLQKLAHKNNIVQDVSYTRLPTWWAGISFMAIGELGNFSAYSMIQASIVAPLGAVAVIFNAILSSVWLREKITWHRITGILIAILGITLITVNAPHALDEHKDVYTNIVSWRSLGYFAFVIAAAILIANYGEPQKHLLSCCIVCGFMSSVSVTSAKAISTALNMALSNQSTAMFLDPNICWLTYLLFFAMPASIVIQINFLNKALKHFDSSQVIPTHYIIFTTICLSASMIVFLEIHFKDKLNIAFFITGLLLAFAGVYLVIRFTEQHSKKIQVIIIQTHEEEEEECAFFIAQAELTTD